MELESKPRRSLYTALNFDKQRMMENNRLSRIILQTTPTTIIDIILCVLLIIGRVTYETVKESSHLRCTSNLDVHSIDP